ncbi:MAG: glycosyltransferase family 1 protein [Rhodopirellula sp.]|nr:glycosyltransferase family 1 protein [Rhodopirellula sp.]
MLTPFELPESQCLAGLRVVHAANLQLSKDGSVFYNCDQKIQHGLIQNGCFAYPFSINDRARMLSWTGGKNQGRSKANNALITTCINVQPDLLILGHAQYIKRETLLEIRQQLPNIRIALWYIDPLWESEPIRHIFERRDVFDGVFATTGGEMLKALAGDGCPAAFIPNPVYASIERSRAFENPNPEYDLVFWGSDRHAPERIRFLKSIVDSLPDLRFGVFGCLGNPGVFGKEKEDLLPKCRMGLNLSRRNDIDLYSSDRIAQIAGNGLLTVTPAGGGLEKIYNSNEVLYFSDPADLVQKLDGLLKQPERAAEMARNAWRKSHEQYSAATVARFIVDLSMRNDRWKSVSWSEHVYGL